MSTFAYRAQADVDTHASRILTKPRNPYSVSAFNRKETLTTIKLLSVTHTEYVLVMGCHVLHVFYLRPVADHGVEYTRAVKHTPRRPNVTVSHFKVDSMSPNQRVESEFVKTFSQCWE
jgi:hypothetical protein